MRVGKLLERHVHCRNGGNGQQRSESHAPKDEDFGCHDAHPKRLRLAPSFRYNSRTRRARLMSLP